MTDAQLIEFYVRNAELMVCNDIIATVLRAISWAIVKGLAFLADVCKILYDTTFGLVDFTTWSGGTEFIYNLKPAFIGLMAVSLFALGIMLIFNHEKKPKIIQNICIACLCVTCSTVVFTQLNELTLSFKSGVENIDIEGQSFDGPYDIVSNNLYDIVYLDEKMGLKNVDFESDKEDLPHADLKKRSFNLIDYTEIINYDTDRFDWSDSGEAQTILKNKLFTIGEDNYRIADVYNGWGFQSGDEDDLFNEFYYRYKLDFFPTAIMLGALIVVYLAMSYKVIRLEIELFVSRILAYLYSAELSGGQRIVKILFFIRDTYILLNFTTILVRCFYFAAAFCQSQIDNTLVECIIILFIAFVVIDGPNIIESLLGMDAGLSSSTSRIFAAYHTAKAAAATAATPLRWGARHIQENRRFDRMSSAMDRNREMRNDERSSDERNSDFMNNSNENSSQQNRDSNNSERGYMDDDNRVTNNDRDKKTSQYAADTSFMEEKENYSPDGRDNSQDNNILSNDEYVSSKSAESEKGESDTTGKSDLDRQNLQNEKTPDDIYSNKNIGQNDISETRRRSGGNTDREIVQPEKPQSNTGKNDVNYNRERSDLVQDNRGFMDNIERERRQSSVKDRKTRLESDLMKNFNKRGDKK